MLVPPPSELPLAIEGTFRLPELLAKIAPRTGPAACVPGLADEVVMVWNVTETATSLREKLPNLLHARWTPGENGVPTLVRDPAKVAQAREEGIAERARLWEGARARAGKDGVYDLGKEFEKLAKPPTEDEWDPDVGVGGAALEAFGTRLLRLFTVDRIARFPLDARTVLALRPHGMQISLPRGADREWRVFLTDLARRRPLFARVAPKRKLPLANPAGFLVSSEEGALSVTLLDVNDVVVDRASMFTGYDGEEEAPRPKSVGRPVPVPPESTERWLATGFDRRARFAAGPTAVRRARARWWPRLADPVAFEPLADEPGPRWMAAARDMGRPCLAVLSDRTSFLWNVPARRASETMVNEWNPHILRREDGPWTLLAPRTDLPAWDVRLSRRALKRAIADGARTGRWGPENLADATTAITDFDSLEPVAVAALSPYLDTRSDYGVFRILASAGLPFWGGLASVTRDSLRAGREIPVGELPLSARARLWRVLNTDETGKPEPTLIYPTGLPAAATLRLTRAAQPFLQTAEDRESRVAGLDATAVAALLAPATDPVARETARQRTERLMAAPLFVGEGTEWSFELRLGARTIAELDAREAVFAAKATARYADLPEAFRRKVEEERVRIAQSRAGEKPPAVPPPF